APWPHRLDSLCKTQSKIEALDQAHATILGLQTGEVLSWGEAKKRIRARMTEDRFDSACAPCEWKSLGHCRTALRKLHTEAAPQ
ncbi:MAG: DUF1284 domain-containing protein, partial [Bdellovibrionota bacterium]